VAIVVAQWALEEFWFKNLESQLNKLEIN
jgi:hypothetical protein